MLAGTELSRTLLDNVVDDSRVVTYGTRAIIMCYLDRDNAHLPHSFMSVISYLVGFEQPWNLILVSLQLVEHGQQQAIYEHRHIGLPVILTADHHKLAYRQQVVLLRLLNVDERCLASSHSAVVHVVLDVHTFCHQLVDAAVFEQR